MNSMMQGKCSICGKVGLVERKYYYYDIKCDCHSPKHFEIVEHCKECVPKPPHATNVMFFQNTLKPMEE